MFVFSGQSNSRLAEQLAEELHTSVASVELTRFANAEMRVWVKQEKVGQKAIVVQSLSSPVEEHLVEFCFLCDALHRMGVVDLYAVIPWLGYSKQDKVFRFGESLSVKVIAKMLQVVPLRHIYTFDLHNTAILGFFDVPVTNLSAVSLFVQHMKHLIHESTIIAAPDAGAVKASTSFAHELQIPVVYLDKKRNNDTGEVTIEGMSRSVSGCSVVILDDMIVTGGTLVETASFLKQQGAKDITVCATHHLYLPTVQKNLEDGGIDHIVVTDTIAQKEVSEKLTVLSIAPMVGSAFLSNPG